MGYLLDTNICIYIIKKSPAKVLKRLEELTTEGKDIYISSITVAELFYGVEKSSQKENNLNALKGFLSLFKIVDFDNDSARIFGEIRASLKKSGNIIGPYDLQIASTAISLNLTLVTNNLKEFNRVQGLKLDNWI